ncbi:hypothetical protein F4810DRAFT_56940 [Camillea tinctor]|nr:hypothetical protein F4810DRAFT_56940 [Camillea tinctor]
MAGTKRQKYPSRRKHEDFLFLENALRSPPDDSLTNIENHGGPLWTTPLIDGQVSQNIPWSSPQGNIHNNWSGTETSFLSSYNNAIGSSSQLNSPTANIFDGRLFPSQPFTQKSTGVISEMASFNDTPPRKLNCLLDFPLAASDRSQVEDDRGGESQQSVPSQQSYQTLQSNDNRILACPFYKMNSGKYSDCRTNILRRIKDVKQHVYRKHGKPSIYCAMCFEVFHKATLRDDHIKRRSCQEKPDPMYDGISEDQKKALSDTNSRGKLLEDQWFDVWAVIFPHAPMPISPFLGSYREEVEEFTRSIWCRKSGLIFKSIGAESIPGVDQAACRNYVTRVMDMFFEQIKNESTDTGSLDGTAFSKQTNISSPNTSRLRYQRALEDDPGQSRIQYTGNPFNNNGYYDNNNALGESEFDDLYDLVGFLKPDEKPRMWMM